MPITPSANSWSMSGRGNLGLLVHLAHERANLAIGELVDAVAEDDFVFGQAGQRRARRRRVGAAGVIRETLEKSSEEVHGRAAGSSKKGMLSCPRAGSSVRRRYRDVVRPVTRGRARLRSLRHGHCCRRRASRSNSTPQPAAPRSRRPGNAAGRPQQPTFRTGINFVRVDAIVTDRQGNPVADLKPDRFRSARGRQAADDRVVPAS